MKRRERRRTALSATAALDAVALWNIGGLVR